MLAPAQDAREERPWIGERGHGAFALVLGREASGHRIAVGAGLLLGHQPIAVENGRAEHQADRLDIAQPFKIGIDDGHVSSDSLSPLAGRGPG